MTGLLTSVVALAGVPVAAAAPSPPATFRSADGAAACRVSAAEAICANRKVQRGAKPVALLLPRHGSPRVVYRSLAWSSHTPVLARGASRRHGHITCTAVDSQLLCRSGGAAIVVSAAAIAVLAAPAVHHG